MKKLTCLAMILALGSGAAAAFAGDITGAGATFPAPVYSRWANLYKAQTGSNLNYQAIGSGGGIKQIIANTVDFGASDKPLMPADLAKNGLMQFPTVVGGVVPVLNVPGIKPGQLRLTGPILADIYRGVRTRWNDPIIQAYNPNLKLPDMPITVVHRSDGSGTTFLFTSFLSKQARHWASGPGASDTINWPVGIGGKGNGGVSALVKQTPGAIGYVEYAYTMQNHMTYAIMKNKAGYWVRPNGDSFDAAAAHGNWATAPGFYLLLLDEPGRISWPITGATFILMHTHQPVADTGASVLKFFDFSYENGDPDAEFLDYVPLPDRVKNMVRQAWLQIRGPDGRPVYRHK